MSQLELGFYFINLFQVLNPVSYTHLRAHETDSYLVCRLLLEKKQSIKNKKKVKNYYVKESVGIATGILISCLHFSGLSMLTHTPSPMNFLNTILKRPVNEKPFVLLVVGKPKDNCMIPVYATKKKTFNKISSIF